MTKSAKSLIPLAEVDSESLDEYIERKQVEFIQFLTRQRLARNLDEVNFKRLVSEVCEGKTWDEACDHFFDMWEKTHAAIKENMVSKIQKRIVNGSRMIDAEPDPELKRGYIEVYDALLKKLESLKGV